MSCIHQVKPALNVLLDKISNVIIKIIMEAKERPFVPLLPV
jgi:hypothetical protein